MADNYVSLVFFTVLTQTAVGALFFRELILAQGGFSFISEEFRKRTLLVIISILSLALIVGFFHLGNPLHAYHALNNIGSSWLSREILFLSLLIGTLLFYLTTEFYKLSNTLLRIISFLSIILCMSLIYCMIRLYMIQSAVSWNHPSTPVSFILTSFLCGFTIVPVIVKNNNTIDNLVLPLASLFIIFSIVNSIIFQGVTDKPNIALFILRISLSVLSLGILTIRKFKPLLNKTGTWSVMLFGTVFISEIINRLIFFLSFEKAGL